MEVLTNKLQSFMDGLINRMQIANIYQGKLHHGQLLYTNEIVHHSKKDGIKNIIRKLDFSKAFDRIMNM